MKNKELYHCNFCNKSFVIKDNLYKHLSKNKDCYDFYYHDKIENINYVTCKICNKRLNNISRRHLKTHDMTTEEYIIRFPDAVLIAEETKEKQKQTFIKNYNCENPSQSDYIKNKKEQTNLDRYGVKNPFESEEIKNKIKQTNLDRYGVENPSQSDYIKNKKEQTFLDRYGVKNPSQSDYIKNKIKQTNLDRYGVKNPFESEEIKNKIKQTNLDRYGVENPSESEEIKNKMKQTNLDRYGVEYSCLSDIIKNKIKQTNLDRYGVEYPLQSRNIRDKSKKTCLKKYGVEYSCLSDIVKDKIRDTMKRKYGLYYRSMPGFSLNSQELFTSIELILLDLYPDLECFYATNKKIELAKKLVTNEYQVLVESVSDSKKIRFLDFYIPTLNKWIEFDEKYHDNSKQLYNDNIREQEIKTIISDIQLLRIKEEDYLNDKDVIIEKCIKFIIS